MSAFGVSKNYPNSQFLFYSHGLFDGAMSSTGSYRFRCAHTMSSPRRKPWRGKRLLLRLRLSIADLSRRQHSPLGRRICGLGDFLAMLDENPKDRFDPESLQSTSMKATIAVITIRAPTQKELRSLREPISPTKVIGLTSEIFHFRQIGSGETQPDSGDGLNRVELPPDTICS